MFIKRLRIVTLMFENSFYMSLYGYSGQFTPGYTWSQGTSLLDFGTFFWPGSGSRAAENPRNAGNLVNFQKRNLPSGYQTWQWNIPITGGFQLVDSHCQVWGDCVPISGLKILLATLRLSNFKFMLTYFTFREIPTEIWSSWMRRKDEGGRGRKEEGRNSDKI